MDGIPDDRIWSLTQVFRANKIAISPFRMKFKTSCENQIYNSQFYGFMTTMVNTILQLYSLPLVLKYPIGVRNTSVISHSTGFHVAILKLPYNIICHVADYE